MKRHCIGLVAALVFPLAAASLRAAELEWIRIADDGRRFVFAESGGTFRPWGFNYDHDAGDNRLIEDYWEEEWETVVEDFQEMRELGANVVRIHLQLGKFMRAPGEPNEASLARLEKLVGLAERTRLYLDLTGLGCYHKRDVPPWYDRLGEAERWEVQARFWEAVAARCAKSPVIFCYDLMNEPVVPGGSSKRDDWLGPPFADKHFVQFIALETRGRPRHEIARQWVERLVAAIRKHDRRHLVTVGLVPWSLDRPGLTSGFIPDKVTGPLDFVAVHIYPEKGKGEEALQTLRGFAIGKPVVIEETFPLKCSVDELREFIEASDDVASGSIGFYWGKKPDEYRPPATIADAVTAKWLELFQELGRRRGG